MMEIFSVIKLFTIDQVDDFMFDAESVFANILKDYDKKNESGFFDRTRYHPNSKLARIMALRYSQTKSFKLMTEIAMENAHKMGLGGHGKIYLCPVSSIRRYVAGVYLDQRQKSAKFETEPHFDNGFGNVGLSIWVPFQDVLAGDGSLIHIRNKDYIEKYRMGNKNLYNFDSYLNNHSEVDNNFLDEYEPSVKKGEIVAHQNVLHATSPAKKVTRTSINFRLISESELDKRDKNIQKIYKIYNEERETFIDNVLKELGDYSYNNKTIFDLNRDIVHYSQEISWIN